MFRLGGLETGPRLRHLAGVAVGDGQQATKPGRRDGRPITPVRRGKSRPQRAGIEFWGPRRGHEPVEAQRPERQDTGQDLVERLHPLLQRRGLVLRLSLLGFEMLLLAALILFPLALPSLSRQPVVFASLRGQALLQRR